MVYYPKNPDNSPCPPAFELVVQLVKKDEYPSKDPLIRGGIEQDIPTKAKVLSPHAKLHRAEAPVLQPKYATFSGELECWFATWTVLGKCIQYQYVVSLTCTCKDKGFGVSIHLLNWSSSVGTQWNCVVIVGHCICLVLEWDKRACPKVYNFFIQVYNFPSSYWN